MRYIVYKTVNIENSNFYIGVHKQYCEGFDGYLGSGTGLKRAIKKYGKEKFLRETLHQYETAEEAYSMEITLLKDVYKLDVCYNMKPGGMGIRENIHDHSPEWRRKVSIAHTGKKHSEETKQKMAQSAMGNTRTLGYRHSEETRGKMTECLAIKFEKIREEKKERKRLTGMGPGLKWWNNGEISSRRRECPEGWVPGRLKS